jgi:hypothetical protein
VNQAGCKGRGHVNICCESTLDHDVNHSFTKPNTVRKISVSIILGRTKGTFSKDIIMDMIKQTNLSPITWQVGWSFSFCPALSAGPYPLWIIQSRKHHDFPSVS